LDFANIIYLKSGNSRQQLAYATLVDLGVFNLLLDAGPLLAGTIPIGIDIPGSDLDIICRCENHHVFSERLIASFSHFDSFEIKQKNIRNIPSTIARFQTKHFPIEIFAQDVPSKKQNAFRHMLVEYRLLGKYGKEFKEEIIQLKLKGWKTEPAFAHLLGLEGDAYELLLDL